MNSYEFKFISKFSLALSLKFPEIAFLHPFHDGVAVTFKIEDKLYHEEGMNSIAIDISNEMSLKLSV